MATVTDQLVSDISKALATTARDLTNQDNFFFGTGDVNIIKQDGTTGKAASLDKLLKASIGNLSLRGPLGDTDLNSINGLTEGKYQQSLAAKALTSKHYPVDGKAGILLNYSTGVIGNASSIQIYITADASPHLYIRFGSAATSGATSATYSAWIEGRTAALNSSLVQTIAQGGTGAANVTDAKKNLNLGEVINQRQAAQFRLAASQGNGTKYYKIATLKNTVGVARKLNLIVTGGVDSGQAFQYVDHLFLSGRNMSGDVGTAATNPSATTATDFKNPEKFISIYRLGPLAANTDDAPMYGYVRRSGGTAAAPTVEMDVYIRGIPYGSDIFLTVLDCTSNIIDAEPTTATNNDIIFYPNTTVTSSTTAPTNHHTITPNKIYDSTSVLSSISSSKNQVDNDELRLASPADQTAFIFRNPTGWGCNKGSTKIPLGLQYGGTGATGGDDNAAAAAARSKLGVAYGTTAGTVAQGNDSRLNTVNGKTGGTITTGITCNGASTWTQTLAVVKQTPLDHTPNATGKTGVWLGDNSIWGYGTGEYENPNPGAEARTLQLVFKMNETSPMGIETFGADLRGNHFEYRGVASKGGNDYKIFAFRHNDGHMWIPGTYDSGSDIRYKSDFKFINTPLKSLLSLRGVTFKRKDTDRRSVGLIAQDAEKVCPEAISTRSHSFSDGQEIKDFKSLTTGDIAAAFSVEAMKEMVRLMQRMLDDPDGARKEIGELIAAINDELPEDFGGAAMASGMQLQAKAKD